MKKLFLVFIATFLSAASICAQPKVIDGEVYNKAWRSAITRDRNSSYRKTERIEYFDNDTLTSSEDWVYEYIKPDKRRFVHVSKRSDRTTKSEWIEVGTVTFCRRNDGEWEVSRSCVGGGSGSGISDIISEKFTLENIIEAGKKVAIYEQYTTHKNTYGSEKDRSRLRFSHSKLWLNEKGKMTREVHRNGLLTPEQPSSVTTTDIQYEPADLKIEPPLVVRQK